MVLLAALCAVVSNSFAGPERKLKWTGAYTEPVVRTAAAANPAPPSASPVSAAQTGTWASHPDKPWVEISGDDVVALHARGNVLFLDARRSSVYRDGHIPGARPMSVWEADIDDKVRQLFSEGRDQSAPVVVYCSGGDCEDSHMLGQKLYFVGFDNVLVYKDGFPDWQKRGHPVTKGDTP